MTGVERDAVRAAGGAADRAGGAADRPGGRGPARPDLVLVTMPFQHVQFPSLAVGLLKAILAREGFAVRAVYANLRFAGRCGLDAALLGEREWHASFFGDWLFQRALFPGAEMPAEEWVRDYAGAKRLTEEELKAAVATAAALRADAEAFLDDLAAEIVASAPAAVGCTVTAPQLTASLALLRRVRELAPDVVTLAGGPGCEAGPGRALHEGFPFVDHVVSGDADELIAPLLSGILERGAALPGDGLPEGVYAPWHRAHGYPDTVDGATYRGRVASLAGLPTPDYDEYFATLAASPALREAITPGVSFESSRGCWWADEVGPCAFCGDCGSWLAYRRKPAGQALADIRSLRERYGASRFTATDNVIDCDYFDGFLDELAADALTADAPPAIFYELRPDVTREQVRSLRRAGVTYAQAGLESLHTPALRAVRKGVAAWQNLQCLRWMREAGVRLSWFIMTKIPGEDDAWNEAQAELVPLLTHLQPPNFVGKVRPERFNRYFRDAGELGLRIRLKEPYLALFAPAREAAEGFSFHFEDVGMLEELSDPLAFMVRPGREFVARACRQWHEVFDDPATRPRLEWYEDGDALRVLDTRPVAVAAEHLLTGLEKDVLLLADAAPHEDDLAGLLPGEAAGAVAAGPPSDAAVREAVEALVERRLVLRIDGRLLALPVAGPCLDYAGAEELGTGWVKSVVAPGGENAAAALLRLRGCRA